MPKYIQLGQVSSNFVSAKKMVKLAVILLQQKMVKLAVNLLQQKNGQVSSKFAAAKNGQVSSKIAAAKNGQVSSKFAAVKMVNFLLPIFQVSSKNGKLFVADFSNFYLAVSSSVNDANRRKLISFITPMTRDMG